MQGNKPFASYHVAMALKYGGISFIAGSVSHGVFSGERSFLTALIGVVAFILGTWLENRDSGETGKALFKSLLVSTLLAISLGLFTGSLQHFPDSPYRSVWAVPLGFALSLVALALMQSEGFSRAFKRYALVFMAVVSVGSAGA